MSPLLGYENRVRHSPFYNLMREAAVSQRSAYFAYLRMTPTIFEELCSKVGPHVHRDDSRFRKSITVGESIEV